MAQLMYFANGDWVSARRNVRRNARIEPAGEIPVAVGVLFRSDDNGDIPADRVLPGSGIGTLADAQATAKRVSPAEQRPETAGSRAGIRSARSARIRSKEIGG